jgi:hypothetical protein
MAIFSGEAVGMTPRHLRATWVRAKRPTVAQLLGKAVTLQTRFSVIRFPSEAARLKGFEGANVGNVVIFRGIARGRRIFYAFSAPP